MPEAGSPKFQNQFVIGLDVAPGKEGAPEEEVLLSVVVSPKQVIPALKLGFGKFHIATNFTKLSEHVALPISLSTRSSTLIE